MAEGPGFDSGSEKGLLSGKASSAGDVYVVHGECGGQDMGKYNAEVEMLRMLLRQREVEISQQRSQLDLALETVAQGNRTRLELESQLEKVVEELHSTKAQLTATAGAAPQMAPHPEGCSVESEAAVQSWRTPRAHLVAYKEANLCGGTNSGETTECESQTLTTHTGVTDRSATALVTPPSMSCHPPPSPRSEISLLELQMQRIANDNQELEKQIAEYRREASQVVEPIAALDLPLTSELEAQISQCNQDHSPPHEPSVLEPLAPGNFPFFDVAAEPPALENSHDSDESVEYEPVDSAGVTPTRPSSNRTLTPAGRASLSPCRTRERVGQEHAHPFSQACSESSSSLTACVLDFRGGGPQVVGSRPQSPVKGHRHTLGALSGIASARARSSAGSQLDVLSRRRRGSSVDAPGRAVIYRGLSAGRRRSSMLCEQQPACCADAGAQASARAASPGPLVPWRCSAIPSHSCSGMPPHGSPFVPAPAAPEVRAAPSPTYSRPVPWVPRQRNAYKAAAPQAASQPFAPTPRLSPRASTVQQPPWVAIPPVRLHTACTAAARPAVPPMPMMPVPAAAALSARVASTTCAYGSRAAVSHHVAAAVSAAGPGAAAAMRM